MATRTLVITIDDADGTGDAEYAIEEILGGIEDANDSDELGGCDVSWERSQ